MAPRAHTIKVDLYCPFMSRDVSDHYINLSYSSQVILEKIGGALGTPRPCFAYNTKREPIYDFNSVKAGHTLLIATSYFDRVLPESKKDVKMIQPGPAEERWMNLPAVLKKSVVEGLRKDHRRARDDSDSTIYLTLPFHIASAKLHDITSTCSDPLSKLAPHALPLTEECLATMQENWDAPIEAALGFPGLVMPHGDVESWEDGLLAMLAVLSEATMGQVDVVATLIVEQVKERTGGSRAGGGVMVVEMEDVRSVAEGLFRRGL